MGVTGLWRLVEPSGKPVPLESLENKVLAIDVSIWLHQAIKGFQDSQGAALPNAHLLGIYHRVCKLLYFRIKPVFVFDGGVPHLKKETIIKRQQQRSKKLTEAERIQQQLLTTLLKHEAVKNVLSETTKATLKSPKSSPTKAKESDNLYKLPPTDFNSSVTSSDEETSESDYSSPSKTWDLHTINEKSEHFKSLPADVRHDILTELKETRKQSSWGKIHEMPKKSDDFSDFQMKRLLKRFSVQESLDEATKEMGGHSLSIAELEVLLKEQGVVTSSGSRIASDENARYLLIKDLKKTIEEAKLQEDKKKSDDVEYQTNLEAAIQLSLQDVPSTSKDEANTNFVENFCDGDFQSSSDNSDIESNNLVTAKNYMVEYSGLTRNEIDKIIGGNVAKKKKTSTLHLDDESAVSSTDKVPSTNESESSDDDFLEVSESSIANIHADKKDGLEIVIQHEKHVQDEDDIFADIFYSSTEIATVTKPIGLENIQKSSKSLDQHQSLLVCQQSKTSDSTISQVHTNDVSPESDNATYSDTTKETSCNIPNSVDQTEESLEMVERQQSKVPDEMTLIPNPDDEVDNSLKNSLDDTTFAENNINQEEITVTSSTIRLTTEDLENMAVNLRDERLELEAGRHTKERLANNLTDQIYQEAQDLLQLFGVPYITAPMEAEAQCAFLNSINLTDGTITDDSDVWLFGGKTVYKNFFNQRKHVLEYRLESIQQHFKLTREQMILLALLVGSDYTTGLQGVGPVTALEILAKFPSTDDVTSGLTNFRKWLSMDKTGPGRNITLRNKLKNVTFTEGFPSLQVVKAYLEPTVDTSEESFSWAKPDINGLIEFARQKFGWNRIKSEEILKPVLKQLNENTTQRSIKDYFQTKHKIIVDAEAKMSKRVKKAVEAIGRGTDNNTEAELKPQKKRLRKKINNPQPGSNIEAKPGTSTMQEDDDLQVLKTTLVESKKRVKQIKKDIEKQIKKPTVVPDLHKKEVIPQKEQDKVIALRSKLKAIEVLRKSRKGPGFVKKRKPVKRKLKDDAELSESSSD